MIREIRRRLSYLLGVFALSLMIALASQLAQAQVALIIGNDYRATGEQPFFLPNTISDTALISQSLGKTNVKSVTTIANAGAQEFADRLQEFLVRMPRGETLLVYYAGHGIQVSGMNYMVTNDLEGFISVQALIDTLQRYAGALVVVLDACRDNPFEAAGGEQISGRSLNIGPAGETLFSGDVIIDKAGIGRGLAQMQPTGNGLMLVFSTDPGAVALDGLNPNSVNSPFAEAFAERIGDRASLEEVLTAVSADVQRRMSQVGALQTPWRQSSLTQGIYLNGAPTARGADGFKLPPL